MVFEPLVVTVSEERAETRLDRFLPPELSRLLGVTISRRRVRRWIEQGAVFVEGRRVRVASRALRPGWKVVLQVDPLAEERRSPLWEMEARHLLFEDEHLLALDKPSGVASQALRDDARDHLLAAATRYLRRRGEATERDRVATNPVSTSSRSAAQILAVHRLDRGTSGLVVVARSSAVASALGEAFAEQRVRKTYRVVVETEGADSPPETWRAEGRLATETLAGGRRRAVVSGTGRSAATGFCTLARRGDRAWIEARPETGRTHQIRVHLADGGWPIVGDRLYGRGSTTGRGRQRLMLHAHRLVFDHPITGRQLELTSPLPTGFDPIDGEGQGRAS